MSPTAVQTTDSTHRVTIAFRRQGAQPPMYLAGTFSDPAWQPRKMQYTVDGAGEHCFTAAVSVQPGLEYRYKFRTAGTLDWVVDDHGIIVMDDDGNAANLLKVPVTNPGPAKAISCRTDELPDSFDALDDSQDFKSPLFAHEAFGANQTADDGMDHKPQDLTVNSASPKPSFGDYSADCIDLDDPTLEKFPFERLSVLDMLRRIQSSHDEDHPHVGERQLSPRTARPMIGMADSRDCRNGQIPRASESRPWSGSLGPVDSAGSLGSIAEEPRDGTGRASL